MRNVRCGVVRKTNPAAPVAATRPEATMPAAEAIRYHPLGSTGPLPSARYGSQATTPRKTRSGEVIEVVIAAASIQSRNGGEYRPSIANGTTNHSDASTMPSAHHPAKAATRRLHGRVTSHTTPNGKTANVATAFTPPMQPNAKALSRPHRRGFPDVDPRTRGINTHGASMVGHDSMLIAPKLETRRGANIKASAPKTRAGRLLMPNRLASLTMPRKPTQSSNDHHSRCTAQAGNPSV